MRGRTRAFVVIVVAAVGAAATVVVAFALRSQTGSMTARPDPIVDAARDAIDAEAGDAQQTVDLASARFVIDPDEAKATYPGTPLIHEGAVWYALGAHVFELPKGSDHWRSYRCPTASGRTCRVLGAYPGGEMWLLELQHNELAGLLEARHVGTVVPRTAPRLQRYGTIAMDDPADVFAVTMDGFGAPGPIQFATSSDAGAHWIETIVPSGPDPNVPLVAYFHGKDAHAAVGGTLHSTSDGGHTWRAAPIPVGSDVEFRNALDGFLLDAGHLQRTRDGGRTWTSVVLPAPAIPRKPPSFETGAADTTSVMLSTTHLFRTSDGGDTWAAAALPVSGLDGEGSGLRFLAYRPGHTDTLQLTADGGVTWKEVPLPLPATDVDHIELVDNDGSWVALASFWDEDRRGRVLLRSDDDGETWRLLPAPHTE